MTDDVSDQIREKDHAVLTCIRKGRDNTRLIREVTTLSNRDVNYSLDKLEDLGLIETETPNSRVTAIVNGQKRNFKAPREAVLTDRGRDYFTRNNHEPTKHQEMTDEELVERVQKLEQEIDAIQNAFKTFRYQVIRELDR